MKTIAINENKVVEIKGIKAKQLSILMNHYSKLRKKASEDEEIAMALSGLMYVFKEESKQEKGLLNMVLPQIISTFYDELLAVLVELFNLTEEEVGDLELYTLVEIVGAFIEETDFEKMAKVLGKFLTPLQQKALQVAAQMKQ